MLLIFRKNHKATFLLLALLSDEKRDKSHLRGFSILLKITFRVHELVARAMRDKCVRHRSNVKVGGFATLHNFSYTTRANISHEKAEQIRARIVCTPAEKWVAGVGLASALTEWKAYLLFCLLVVLGLCA